MIIEVGLSRVLKLKRASGIRGLSGEDKAAIRKSNLL